MSARESWDELRFVLAAARAGSLRPAARSLGVDQSTLSRRIASLERRLCVRLFDRLPTGLALTSAGERITEAAERMDEEATAVSRFVMGQDLGLQGTLRLTTSDPLATALLMPHLARFAAAHPEVELGIVSTFEFLSLARREADVAIRVARSRPEGVASKRLAKVAVAVYGSVDLIESQGGSVDLDATPWIGWESEELNLNHRLDLFQKAQIRYRVNSTLVLIEALRSGMAIGSLACYHGDNDPRLRRIVPEAITDGAADLWMLVHRDVQRATRVRLFLEFMAEAIAGERDRLEGRRP